MIIDTPAADVQTDPEDAMLAGPFEPTEEAQWWSDEVLDAMYTRFIEGERIEAGCSGW